MLYRGPTVSVSEIADFLQKLVEVQFFRIEVLIVPFGENIHYKLRFFVKMLSKNILEYCMGH